MSIFYYFIGWTKCYSLALMMFNIYVNVCPGITYAEAHHKTCLYHVEELYMCTLNMHAFEE